MKIGIVGLGLIGGSLGLDLRQSGNYNVLGVSRREEICQQAIARGIVDDASTNLTFLATADVIFLCTPLGAIESTANQLIPHLSPNTILTDVGSVKVSIVEAIAPQWQNFVGGHPMAGSTESGLDAVVSELFVNKTYVLTPIESTPTSALEIVEAIVHSLQARIYRCHPQEHDHAVAWISHLPVMISASLIAACEGESDPVALKLAQKFASSGFRDTSRVGGGNPELGVMIARYNQQELVRSLYAYRDQLNQVTHWIEQGDWRSLENHLLKTQQARPPYVD